MATVKQYAINLWHVHKTVIGKMGIGVEWGSVDARAPVLSTDVLLAMIVKILVDKGVVTDLELSTAATQLTNAAFPQLPSVVANSDDAQPLPDPDLGA